MTKTQTGLIPADKDSEDWYNKRKFGEVVRGEFKTVRNYRFHKKWFALLNLGFDNFNPVESEAEKNFERFRKDVIILSGHHHTVVRLDGSIRVEADSVSFASMSEEEFSDLYNKTINVLLKYVYKEDMTPEDLDNIVNSYLAFA